MRLLFLKLTLLLLMPAFVCGVCFVTLMDGTNYNDRTRVLAGLVDLQIAGLRLAASQLQVMDEAQQATWLSQQSQMWRGPLSVCDIADLPVQTQRFQPPRKGGGTAGEEAVGKLQHRQLLVDA